MYDVSGKPPSPAPSAYKPNLRGGAAPPVYRPQPTGSVAASTAVCKPPARGPQPIHTSGVQLKTANAFRGETRPAPPVYRPQPTGSAAASTAMPKPPVRGPQPVHTPGVQMKTANAFRGETRAAPPVYRPQPTGSAAASTATHGPPVHGPQPVHTSGVQLKTANAFRAETRFSPPVYRHVAAHQPVPPPATTTPASRKVFHAATSVQLAERTPTFYTYMKTRETSQLPTTTQGPHTVAHALVSHGFDEQTQDDSYSDLEDVFEEQVPDPTEMDEILEAEMSTSNKKTLKGKLQRFRTDYEILHGTISVGLTDREDDEYDDLREKVRAIMELNPYGTYSWKGGKKASERSRKAKKEKKAMQLLRQKKRKEALLGLIDTGGSFSDKRRFRKFVKRRFSMVATKDEVAEALAHHGL